MQIREVYKSKDDYEKTQNEHTLNDGDWHWMSFVAKGKRANESLFRSHCPVTLKCLEESIGESGHTLMTDTPFSYTFFSTMAPGSKIAPHFGPTNLRLRCHFPLIVPEECFIKVAGEGRRWDEGKMLIFDDSYEHETANLSREEDRVLLLFDIWHPDLH